MPAKDQPKEQQQPQQQHKEQQQLNNVNEETRPVTTVDEVKNVVLTKSPLSADKIEENDDQLATHKVTLNARPGQKNAEDQQTAANMKTKKWNAEEHEENDEDLVSLKQREQPQQQPKDLADKGTEIVEMTPTVAVTKKSSSANDDVDNEKELAKPEPQQQPPKDPPHKGHQPQEGQPHKDPQLRLHQPPKDVLEKERIVQMPNAAKAETNNYNAQKKMASYQFSTDKSVEIQLHPQQLKDLQPSFLTMKIDAPEELDLAQTKPMKNVARAWNVSTLVMAGNAESEVSTGPPSSKYFIN